MKLSVDYYLTKLVVRRSTYSLIVDHIQITEIQIAIKNILNFLESSFFSLLNYIQFILIETNVRKTMKDFFF